VKRRASDFAPVGKSNEGKVGQLENKIALVTGSGRGLGRACALTFAREGAKVAVIDLNVKNGEETVGLIRAKGGDAMFIAADVALSQDVQRMVRMTVETFGGLDCAVNNAVCDIDRIPLADIPEEAWDRALAVNYTGVFLCMKYEIRAMLARGGGAIVNIGSGNEHSAKPGLSWYLSAKQAIYGLTKIAALDYATQGIRVNAVGPGPMWTPAMRERAAKKPGHTELLENLTPLRRIAEPEEVAEAAIWLCTPAASFVLGHTLLADGGAVMGTDKV
jgi:NAD(P)-dependent dehydrogenase (short-subunit alcohol dehydrogenase family)